MTEEEYTYDERRKNNMRSVLYENDKGDVDWFGYNPSDENYYVVRDLDPEISQMALRVKSKNIPQSAYDQLQSYMLEILEA